VAEIERKFLVAEMPRPESGGRAIEQGYLALDERGEVRLRRIGGERRLTAKVGAGLEREEVEVPIDPASFEELWPLTAGRRVRKVRHVVPLAEELSAEIDVYGGALLGLLTVEVEFDSRAAARSFSPPDWFGEELTGDGRYANRVLAAEGLPAAGARRDDAVMHDEAQPEPGVVENAPGADPPPTPPSRAYKLRAGEGAADGMRRIVAGRLDKAAERLREADDGDALAEAIHGARKDLKKARAALRLIREELGEKRFKRENRALRDAGRLLSASRDAEVKLATLGSLVEGAGDAPPAAAAIWRDALLADRDRIVGAGNGAAEATGAAVAAIDEVATRAPRWKIGADGWGLLSPGLDTAYREGREQFLALPADPAFEAVHDLRKRGKDLWYQVRLLGEAWPAVMAATAEEIHDFTDRLGDHHDLAVLAEDLSDREALGAAHRETLRALIEARQETLLGEARALGERIYAERPKAFVRRLRGYWNAWQKQD
jgi:CYTH domain-containing protein/CHAD domain-containing protein